MSQHDSTERHFARKTIQLLCFVGIGALLASAGLVVHEDWQALAIIVLAAIASLGAK